MSEGWDDRTVDLTFTEKAVEFIDQRGSQQDGPLYLHLTPSAPHRPCVPPEAFMGESNAGSREDMVPVVDYMVGEIRSALERKGFLENTRVAVSSDNGARTLNFDGKDYRHKSNGDLRGQKGDIYEGGHREPCLAMWPKVITPGSESDEPLSMVDLFATVADILGVDDHKRSATDSRSFLAVLRGEPLNEPRHEAEVHHALDGMFSVRKGPWKAVFGLGSGGFSEPARYEQAPGGPEGQLFHVHNDARETKNLWQDRPDVVNELRLYLQSIQ
jgi:arylsulfatase A